MITLVLFIIGLCFGSFINALVWRTYTKKPIANDRSECPNCHHKLSAADLVPVLSWLLLRGKCRYCMKPISPQYPVVELITAGLFAFSYWRWPVMNLNIEYAQFIAWLLVLIIVVALAVYDLKWMLLPNKLMAWLASFAIIFLALSVCVEMSYGILVSHILAAVCSAGFFLGLYAISEGKWMGGGDVKLVFIMGLILGLPKTLVALLIAFNVAALLSIGLIVSGKLGRKSLIPFGPFLLGGLVASELFGQAIIDWYLRFSGIA